MKTKLILLILVSLFLSSVAAFGHHSFAGTYLLDEHKTVRGTVVAFTIRNPHSVVTVEVTDDNETRQRWVVEWGGVTSLKDASVTQSSLAAGDTVTITGAPSRDPREPKLLMQRILRPSDNWKWEGQIGRFKTSNTPLPPIENN